jgi:hypothetical protein
METILDFGLDRRIGRPQGQSLSIKERKITFPAGKCSDMWAVI